MDSFELSKIAGAVLSALLLIFGSRVIIDSRLASAPSSRAIGYVLPVDETKQVQASDTGSAGVKEGSSPFDPKVVLALLTTVKPEEGEAVFKKCAACHVVQKDASSGVAPNLWGVVNRAKGTQPDFSSKYSEALKTKGGNWTYEELAAFLHKPKDYISGTKMAFAGLNDPKDIASVLSYLRTLADEPTPLPK